MTLTELRYIVTLAQERHFGRAAERCYVSQPTLSVAVKKLEDELGIALFERSKSAVQVTPIGEQVIAQANHVLEQANVIKELANQGKDQLSSPLRIGAIYTVGPYLFPHIVPLLSEIAPQMSLYIEEDFTANLRRRLRSGELDIIIIALPFVEPDVLTKIVYEEPFEVLLPKGHPWLDEVSIDPTKISQERMLLLGEGHCFRDQILEAFPALAHQINNPTRTLVTENGSLETIRHMVATRLGITILPRSATGLHFYETQLLATRPFNPPAPSRRVAIAWRTSFPRPKAIDVLTLAIERSRSRSHLSTQTSSSAALIKAD